MKLTNNLFLLSDAQIKRLAKGLEVPLIREKKAYKLRAKSAVQSARKNEKIAAEIAELEARLARLNGKTPGRSNLVCSKCPADKQFVAVTKAGLTNHDNIVHKKKFKSGFEIMWENRRKEKKHGHQPVTA